MAMWVILACMAFIILAGSARGRGGVAFADVTTLVILLGIIALADLVLSRFVYTGDTGWTLAALFAGAFAVDALYGLMAPERQQRRDRKLRELLRRSRRA
jgi:hypothetical protein